MSAWERTVWRLKLWTEEHHVQEEGVVMGSCWEWVLKLPVYPGRTHFQTLQQRPRSPWRGLSITLPILSQQGAWSSPESAEWGYTKDNGHYHTLDNVPAKCANVDEQRNWWLLLSCCEADYTHPVQGRPSFCIHLKIKAASAHLTENCASVCQNESKDARGGVYVDRSNHEDGWGQLHPSVEERGLQKNLTKRTLNSAIKKSLAAIQTGPLKMKSVRRRLVW